MKILNKTKPLGAVRFLTTRMTEEKYPIYARYDRDLYKSGFKIQTSDPDGILSEDIVGYQAYPVACKLPCKKVIDFSELEFTEDEILNSIDFQMFCKKGYLEIID